MAFTLNLTTKGGLPLTPLTSSSSYAELERMLERFAVLVDNDREHSSKLLLAVVVTL